MNYEDKSVHTGKYRLNISFQTMFCNLNITTEWEHNLITDVGRTLISNLLAGLSTDSIKGMAVGTGTTAAANGDNVLGAEKVRKGVTPSVAGGNVTFKSDFSASEINGTTEVGLVTNTTSGGLLVTRSVHSNGAINMPSNGGLSMEYVINTANGG